MQRTLPQTPQAVLQQLTLAFSGVPGVTLTSPVRNSLVATRRFIPSGAIVFAVLLFPIGLLFLLMKQTNTVTMLVTDREAGSTLEIRGDWDQRIIRVVDGMLSAAGQGPIESNVQQAHKSDLAIVTGILAVAVGLVMVFSAKSLAYGFVVAVGLLLLAVGLKVRGAPAR